MKQSWSERLFFRINKQVGTRPLLDRFMTFCADDLIFFLFFASFLWATTGLFDSDPRELNTYLKLLMTAGAFGFATSWTIGILFPHARPFTEHPRVKKLLRPLGTWKSFPSDHTIASFTVAWITWIMGAPVWYAFGLVVMAFAVAFGRVYVGVHYPRDIVGGIIVATFFSWASLWLLNAVTQPLYDLIRVFFV